MRRSFILLLAASALSTTLESARAMQSNPLPELPAKSREVVSIRHTATNGGPTYQRPHVPIARTTADGRVGIACSGWVPRFVLFVPETMQEPLQHGPGGATTMSREGVFVTGADASNDYGRDFFFPPTVSSAHYCLWDENPPSFDGRYDVYEFKVIVTGNRLTTPTDQDPPARRTRLYSRSVRVRVANPKTDEAYIESVTVLGTGYEMGISMNFEASGFEPMVVGDGRLLVFRIGSGSYTWTPPGSQTPITNPTDTVYSYYEEGPEADVTKWTTLYPIAYAPSDPRINTKFGFARHPFRDGGGKPIEYKDDFVGSYPWIDRDAANLFIEMGNEQFYRNMSNFDGRYSNAPVPNNVQVLATDENRDFHQNICVMGLWTRGKLVNLDNLLNDADYAMGSGDTSAGLTHSRMLTLYDDGSASDAQGQIEVGYTRATGAAMPTMDSGNSNVIDSIESKMHTSKHVVPLTIRDVVWHMSTGRQTDEVIFDDYLDLDAFIVSEMTGHVTTAQTHPNRWLSVYHHSGWSPTALDFVHDVRLQNAATAPASRWVVPAYGLVSATGRLEPVANGGFRGKGFWLANNINVQYDVPHQVDASKYQTHDWYYGIFIDPRNDGTGAPQRLLSFPDGSSLQMHGIEQVHYVDASDEVLARISLPNTQVPGVSHTAVSLGAWAHLALQVMDAGHRVDFYLNGLLYHRWRSSETSLFQLSAGTLVLGRGTGSSDDGFRGWIDDFKVFAHTVDAELACNHAGGTLVGLRATSDLSLRQRAEDYPAWAHDEVREALRQKGQVVDDVLFFYNHHNYTEDEFDLRGSLPAGCVSLREHVIFPEGPLFFDRPRPDSRSNKFCLSCHETGAGMGLELSALDYSPGINADVDPRRQPLQPPARMFGAMPAGAVDAGELLEPPIAANGALAANPLGHLVDHWLLPNLGSTLPEVTTITLTDASGTRDLMELTPNCVVDPALLGTDTFAFRANTDMAQAPVLIQFGNEASVQVDLPPYTHSLGNGKTLSAGSYTIRARTQSSSTWYPIAFTVPDGQRKVASYQDGFQSHAPKSPWSYRWNATSSLTDPSGHRDLNWSPAVQRYTGSGTSVPETVMPTLSYGQFRSTGGHPGRASSSGNPHDRFVMAGYTVARDGQYSLQDIDVSVPGVTQAQNDGIEIRVLIRSVSAPQQLTQVGSTIVVDIGTATSSLADVACGTLSVGDTIYVAVGAGGNDAYDGFNWDFGIYVSN